MGTETENVSSPGETNQKRIVSPKVAKNFINAMASIFESSKEKLKSIPENAVDGVGTGDRDEINPLNKRSELQRDLYNEILLLIENMQVEKAKVSGVVVENILSSTENLEGNVLIGILGKTKDSLRCPDCNGSLKRSVGRPGEFLICANHGEIVGIRLIPQLPLPLLEIYLKSISLNELKDIQSELTQESQIMKKNEKKEQNQKTEKNDTSKQQGIKQFLNRKDNKPSVSMASNDTQNINTEKSMENADIGEMLLDKSQAEINIILFSMLLDIKGKVEKLTEAIINDGKVQQKPKELDGNEGTNQANYLAAAQVGQINQLKEQGRKSQLSRTEIRQMTSFAFAEKRLESYTTKYYKGIKACPFNLIWKLFEEHSINKKKIKFMNFMYSDILEVDLVEAYEEEFTTILENICKNNQYRDLVIKKVETPERLDSTEDERRRALETRLDYKIQKIEKMVSTAPHMRRVLNYIKLQKKMGTINITMKKRGNEVSLYDLIGKKEVIEVEDVFLDDSPGTTRNDLVESMNFSHSCSITDNNGKIMQAKTEKSLNDATDAFANFGDGKSLDDNQLAESPSHL